MQKWLMNRGDRCQLKHQTLHCTKTPDCKAGAEIFPRKYSQLVYHNQATMFVKSKDACRLRFPRTFTVTRTCCVCRYEKFSYLFDRIIHKMNLLVTQPQERKLVRQKFYSFLCSLCVPDDQTHSEKEEAHFSPSELLNLN